MKASVLSTAFYSGLLLNFAAGASIPRYFEKHAVTRGNLDSTQVQKELGSLVSDTTVIFGTADPHFEDATSRWTDWNRPRIEIVIEPGTEADVATIVKYCNANSIEFLVRSSGHGLAGSLGTFDGIQISTWKLKNINIQASGKSAWFGGGLLVKEAIDYMWDQGYVTTTGGCECVGMTGAALGGDHGRLEGLYGLISDNILQLNVVLGDGSTIRVNSTSHSDLLWGMKGAGHNFGIVTSYEMNIWPQGPETWHYHNYVWRGEHLEAVFSALNKLHGDGTTPVNMAFEAGSFLMNTTISTEEPILFWTFVYRGTAKQAEKYLAPFNAIEAVYDLVGDVPYPEVASAQGTGNSAPICQHGDVHSTSTVFLRTFNTTAERQIFEGFKRRVAEDPVFAEGCTIMHEGYSTKRVEAIDSASSAYPFRADRHLTLFNAIVPHNDTTREAAAEAWAAEVRDQWKAGQPGRPVDAYVNYANGLETLEQCYGHEAWRLKRLRTLKARYDPHNRFRFFNPIVV